MAPTVIAPLQCGCPFVWKELCLLRCAAWMLVEIARFQQAANGFMTFHEMLVEDCERMWKALQSRGDYGSCWRNNFFQSLSASSVPVLFRKHQTHQTHQTYQFPVPKALDNEIGIEAMPLRLRSMTHTHAHTHTEAWINSLGIKVPWEDTKGCRENVFLRCHRSVIWDCKLVDEQSQRQDSESESDS